jgi:uncharacterized protein with FMN-binding domain
MNACSIFRRFTIIVLIGFISTGILKISEARAEKSKEEIDTYIKQVGSSTPDWWNSVELSYPETLDLNWPVQERFLEGRRELEERRESGFPGDRRGRGFRGGRGGRGFRGDRRGHGFGGERGGPGFGQDQNSQRMVDQYLFEVVYPNPTRHREGIKLVNHLMIMHKDDKAKVKRSLNVLGQMFYELFDDYARAAFWWQKYRQMGGSIDSLKMARCYFELGSKEAAEELLSQIDSSYARNNKDIVKLWAKIGEVDKALNMIESNFDVSSSWMGRFERRGRRGLTQSDKYLLSAEICRGAGRYDDAIAYYDKVLALPDSETRPFDHHETDDKFQADVNLAATKLLKKLDLKRVQDGSYNAVVEAYGGPMTVEVVFKSGNIESVEVTRHWETYSYLIMALPTARQIVTKQGFEGVDVITGATVTSDAIINAAAKALFNAME